MDSRTDALLRAEYAPATTHLDTASHGLLPARAVVAVRDAAAEMADGRLDQVTYLAAADAARATFGRLVGLPAQRVALGTSVAAHVGLVAEALPDGAEVLAPEGDFSSLLTPFAHRDRLVLRQEPLEKLAAAVGPDTALVACSAAQSADGRLADLPAVRAAARRVGARTLVDATQAAGWLPLAAGEDDFTVCGAYKWLLSPRGASFLTVPEDGGGLRPMLAGWINAADPWASPYGPTTDLAPDARRYDTTPAFLPYLAAERSLSLIAEIGVERIAAHDVALAERFREGLARLGHRPVAAASPIVAVPGLGAAAERLAEAGVTVSTRAGGLRASFHLYNTAADVDRALTALEEATLPAPQD